MLWITGLAIQKWSAEWYIDLQFRSRKEVSYDDFDYEIVDK